MIMKKILLSSVALLSLVSTLAVSNPVSAQESSSQTTYSTSSGSWIKSGSRFLMVLILQMDGEK